MARELARRMQAEAARRDTVPIAQHEERGEPFRRELLERELDLLVGRRAPEVAHGQLGEVVAQERDRLEAVGSFGAHGPHRANTRVIADE